MLIRITSAAQTNLPISSNGRPTLILPVGADVDLTSFKGYEPDEILGVLDDSHATYEIVDAPAASAGDGADGGIVSPSPSLEAPLEEPLIVEEFQEDEEESESSELDPPAQSEEPLQAAAFGPAADTGAADDL
jgi:hypothetical protein